MRKFLSLLLAAILLLPSFALAQSVTLDLSTATEEELLNAQTAINDALAKLRSSAATTQGEAITLEGSGTAIQTGFQIPFSPSRIEINTTDDITITLTGGTYDHSYDAKTYMCKYLDEPGEFTVLSEGKGKWTLTVTPVTEGGTLEYSGVGPSVGNIFQLTAPTIVTITAKAPKAKDVFSNLIIDICHEYEYVSGWGGDSLTNELLSSGDTFTGDFIIKPEDDTGRSFWSIYCDPGIEWTITLKK